MTRSPTRTRPQDGVSRLLRQQGGLVARVGGLLERPGLRAAAASVRAGPNGLRASVSSLLIPAADDRGRDSSPP